MSTAEPALLGLRRAVRAALGGHDARSVLVALSGGADSLALLAATVPEGARLGIGVGAVVVDHGLQPDSAAVAATASASARLLGADPVEVRSVTVGQAGGPEAAAREARYAALVDAARRHAASAVLLAHTLDDQAETVLLGLTRGSGTRSLSGMPVRTVRDGVPFVRPLLEVRRAQTVAACAELGLDPWADPHNADPAFGRARVRHELMPVLVDVLGPGAVEALARSAALLHDDADALDDWAARVVHDSAPGASIDVDVLAPLPGAVRRRVLRRLALAAGAPAGGLTAGHLGALDALVAHWHGQGAVALPGPVSVARECGRLTFRGR